MESDAERGVGSSEYGGEELSLPLTIASLNRGMDSIVAKAGTLPTLKNVAGITSFERKFKSALEATGRGSFVAEQRAQAERWCCFGFAVASKW